MGEQQYTIKRNGSHFFFFCLLLFSNFSHSATVICKWHILCSVYMSSAIVMLDEIHLITIWMEKKLHISHGETHSPVHTHAQHKSACQCVYCWFGCNAHTFTHKHCICTVCFASQTPRDLLEFKILVFRLCFALALCLSPASLPPFSLVKRTHFHISTHTRACKKCCK